MVTFRRDCLDNVTMLGLTPNRSSCEDSVDLWQPSEAPLLMLSTHVCVL